MLDLRRDANKKAIQCFRYLPRETIRAELVPVLSNTAHKWRFGSHPKPSTKATILCVDEDEELLRLRKGMLEDAGYAVLLATSGARALELLTDVNVSLVLSGHMLRATSGNELAREMKKIKPEVPVVLYC